jgi:ubiquinone biosynthesis protein
MSSTYHHRQVEIAEVLVRFELGHLLEVFGLEGLVSIERRLLRRGPVPTRPESLRKALEELGPTFIKLGQALSARADLLPPDFQAELVKLQDDAVRVPSNVIEEIVKGELGASSTRVFASFDSEPLAAASIGQVHAAILHDGTEVVVKVRRPGSAERVELDLEILQNLAARASRRWKEAEYWDVNGMAKDFADKLRSELDYMQEARSAEQFAANFAADPEVHIPSVYPELTTSRLITLERIRGLKITDLAGLDTAGVDRAVLAERLAHTVAKMVLIDGYYHADPNPGNFFVEPLGRIAIIDFGRVGRIDDNLRSGLSRLLLALIQKDSNRLMSALLSLGPTATRDHAGLRQDLSAMLSRFGGDTIREVPIGAAIGELVDIVRHHKLSIPPDLALLFAVIVIHEGITGQLNPNFRFDDALTPYVQRHLASGLSRAALAHRAEHFGIEVAELVGELPGQIHRLLEVIGDGGFEVHLRTDELQTLVGRVERVGNRLAMSILAAAVIDGLSELAAHKRRIQPTRKQMLAAGVAALTSLGASSAWRRSAVGALLGKRRPTA